ncbi:helix-turn-helix domain-containing protein [Providencia stuartii]|nr:helix-turn-helix domain-containing protein [Providencia sp. PROV122]
MSSTLESKWGKGALSLGWTAIPTVLFFIQGERRLSPTAFNTLLNLIVHWWDIDEWPHPSIESLAIRMGLSTRTIQRALNELEKANLIDRKPTQKNNKKYRGRNIYDLTKLIDYLNVIGPSVADRVREPKIHNNVIYRRHDKSNDDGYIL